MADVSIFADESGEQGFQSNYYALTLVFHDQSDPVIPVFTAYEQLLRNAGLPDIPMHASPLLNGHDDYQRLGISQRKRLLAYFMSTLRKLPAQYVTLIYRKADYATLDQLGTRIKRDIVNIVFDHLTLFQSFDAIKVYYDGGQSLITQAIHGAVEYALSKQAIVYRKGSPTDYRLAQIADLICTIELTALKYENHEQTATDERFFGPLGNFRKNFLKKVRKHQLTAQ
ncbi:DUF3800 domain-containing protein [Bifidobacterium callitrichos]|uniref:DUF3800 domain-containing protein n=1 Tax=Bifidobacterium callitrichos TaxID=762209 RepID=A0A5M9ZBV9_9BIFI|nr:DUF3800 domain-containing protein [Bifidobacterium callitrichos]KAA8815324.1 DUF3800 domain-containing protein [Bifidobacterium callitrichos]